MLVNYSLINIMSAHSLFGVIVLNLRSSGMFVVFFLLLLGSKWKGGWPFQCFHPKKAAVWSITLKRRILESLGK